MNAENQWDMPDINEDSARPTQDGKMIAFMSDGTFIVEMDELGIRRAIIEAPLLDDLFQECKVRCISVDGMLVITEVLEDKPEAEEEDI